MKKLIQGGLLLVGFFMIGQLAFADYTSVPVFSNVTKTSATMNITVGSDDFGTAVQNRQPIKYKYRSKSGTQVIELPLEYNVEMNIPQTVTLTGLKPNQEYLVWIGQRATRTCVGEELCVAVYTKYGNPFTLKTKGDPIKPVLLTQKLSYGNKSNEVLILKKYLANKGYMKPSTTTTFDVPTLVGVIKFQMAKNLETDGILGTSGRAIINQDITLQTNLLNQ